MPILKNARFRQKNTCDTELRMHFSDPLLDQASKGKRKWKTSEEIVVRSEQTIKRNALVDYYSERGKTDIVGPPRKNGLICRNAGDHHCLARNCERIDSCV